MTSRTKINTALKKSPYRDDLLAICGDVHAAGGRALLVGGSVRDALQGVVPQDLDVEVYGLAPERLTALLGQRYRFDLVGRAFGVIKLRGVPIDVALPRRESKTGLGHKGFEVLSDPDMTIEEAAMRRDFTINALAFDPLTENLFDPCNGVSDLTAGVLRHTSIKFIEDPLRVLRGMQFAARFDMRVAPETVALCRTLEPEGLSAERVFDEWKKLIVKGVRPSRGLAFLYDCGWITYYPELAALAGCLQEPEWHPEGDVWTHTLHCMDAFAAEERIGDAWEDLIVGLAVLCHDLGKPATTLFERGRLRSVGHEEAGAGPTRTFLARMTAQQDLIDQVVALVVHHLRPRMLYDARSGDSAIRRLARNVRIDRLVRVSRADASGRPPLPSDGAEPAEWLLQRAHALEVAAAAPTPVVMGRHLLDSGMKPGPELGRLLAMCYEAQLDGVFATLEDGVAFALKWIE